MVSIMSKSELAIHGAPKTINYEFKNYNSMGIEEVTAAKKVVESGVLSKFIGAWHEDFYGGPKVKEFEKFAAHYFGVKHAITVNSWTSGLIAGVGSIGIEPGDEIITTPWTMCASATAILHWNAIPVFADIEDETYCLSPEAVVSKISPKTKAIMAVDIFGHSADIEKLQEISKKYGLKLVSDTAQAPGAKYRGSYAGTLADVGGFSLNYHKHIHTGEGGILVTNDDKIATRLQLIRNHAEAVVGGMGFEDLSNMIGYNFRLGEIECAIGIEQLKKLERQLKSRQAIAHKLTEGLMGLRGLKLPTTLKDCTHSYYVYPMQIDVERLGVSRTNLRAALLAEGVSGLMGGYQNVHLLPMYQKKIAYGSKGFPWSASFGNEKIDYSKGICPVAEHLHDSTFLGFSICAFDLSDDDIALIVRAFKKVWANLHEVEGYKRRG